MNNHAHQRRDPRPISELNMHKGVVDALRFLAVPNLVWWHVANERRATPKEGAFLKRLGVRAGVADINLILPTGQSAFMELKSEKGRLSLEQRLFRDDVTKIGCLYAMPRSHDEALATLQSWGAIRRTEQRRERAA